MGTIEGSLETTKNRLEMIFITVEAWSKDHGQLGIDVLKLDTLKLIYSIKPEKNNIGLLNGY